MLLQQRQRESAQPPEVLTQVLFAVPRFVLAERHVQDPVATVLDTPMAPDRAGELLDVHLQAADVVTGLDRLLPVPQAARRHQPDRPQPLPEGEPGQLPGGRELEVSPRLLAPMARLL